MRFCVLLVVIWLSASAPGCASFGFLQNDRHAQREVRPELPVDYDILVAEMALNEADFPAARSAMLRAAEKDPESAYLQLRLSRISAQLEDMDGAILHAQRAVEIAPNDEEARILLGGFYRISRNVEGAEAALIGEDGKPISDSAALLLYQVYLESDRLSDGLAIAEDLIKNRPDVLGGYMALATIYERMGRPAAAERVLREGLVQHPDRFVLFSRLARLKRSMGDIQGEIEIYHDILEQHPHHRGSLLSLGEAMVAANDLEGAIDVYAEIVDYYPNDMKSLRRFASLEFTAGRVDQAVALLESGLERNPEEHQLAFSLGQILRGRDDVEGALATLERIPPTDPIYYEARINIVAIHEGQEDYASALSELNALRAIRPDRALDFHAAGLYQRSGEFDRGLAIIEGMLSEDPNDEEILYQLGVLYGMSNRIDKAVEVMLQVLELNPDNAHALNYVGYTWAERGEKLDLAEEFILRALVQRPNDGYIADSLGWVYYRRGRDLIRATRSRDGVAMLERARDQLTLAAELTGGDPVVSEHLGDVHLSLDERERAYEFYQEAVEMDHRPEEQPMLLEKLDELRRELEQGEQ